MPGFHHPNKDKIIYQKTKKYKVQIQIQLKIHIIHERAGQREETWFCPGTAHLMAGPTNVPFKCAKNQTKKYQRFRYNCATDLFLINAKTKKSEFIGNTLQQYSHFWDCCTI